MPMSQLAAWSARLAWFALVVALLSILIVRSGVLEVLPALATFGGALVCAALAVLLGLASFVTIWRQGLRGLGRSLTGMFIGAALLTYPGYLGYRAYQLPSLTDISTDIVNPPRFDRLAAQRPADRNAYPAAAAARQQAAYPDIGPVQVEANPTVAYQAALDTVTKRRWQVIDARPPAPPRREGSIEATARTLIMGFREDVVIRITPFGNGSRIDVRSASRFGPSDIGSNAARVRALLDDIEEKLAGEEAEPQPPPAAGPQLKKAPQPAKKPPPPPPKKPAPKRG